MDIVIVTAECAPLAKAGGLGDFVQGLARALATAGDQVEIFLPAYDVLAPEVPGSARLLSWDLYVPFGGRRIRCEVSRVEMAGLQVLLFSPQSTENFFQRGRIYGESDDAERFAFFSRAVLEYLHQNGRSPDVLHCNDWQTALVPVLLQECYQELWAKGTGTCFTIHNLGYQGRVELPLLEQVGLDVHRPGVAQALIDGQDPGWANLMQGAIVSADFVNTVSPRYAWEVLHTEQGMGLQGVLQQHAYKFGGILNGIDPEVWNPATDPLIPVHYGPDSLEQKGRNRAELRRRLGLRETPAPVLAVVSRLDWQKGVDLVEHGIGWALNRQAQVVVLGSALDPEIAARFDRLHQQTADHPDCHLELRYDEQLAHLIYAGADLILIPSLYEPCGLTQMIALRYGTVPVARRVGGLADTICDVHYSDQPFTARNGYLFDAPSPAALDSALERALQLWHAYPEYFHQLRLNGMRIDHSWAQPARHYRELYQYVHSLAGL